MDPRQAAHTLEVIRTLMERTCQYRLLTAGASLAAGTLALLGASAFFFLDAGDAAVFATVWGFVFASSLTGSFVGTLLRGREVGERVWTRQTRMVLLALTPALTAAAALTVFFFVRGDHLWLPGVWMLCYGQGTLATSAYAPSGIRWLGIAMLVLGTLTLALGAAASILMMGLAFGLGHLALGFALLSEERRERAIRLYRSVA
ncbi:MAG: hypothetical protein ACRELG_17750 [Gemmataceae bacterium]